MNNTQSQLQQAINSATKIGHTNHAMLLLKTLRALEAGKITAQKAEFEALKIAFARAAINPINNPK